MLMPNILHQSIVSKISKKLDTQVVHRILINQIQTHIKTNLQVNGIYVGMLPLVPDSLSGPVIFNMSKCQLDYQKLKRAASKDLNVWYKQLCNQIKISTTLATNSVTVGLFAPIQIFSTITPSELNIINMSDFILIWNKIITTLVMDIKMSPPKSTPAPAYSVSGGIGTINFTNFI